MKINPYIFILSIFFIFHLIPNAISQQLIKPSFVENRIQGDSLAFPSKTAGIAAYSKIDQSIDVTRLKPIFNQVVDVGDNFIIGIVPINDIAITIDVYLYADSDGWFVAYLPRSEPAVKIMQWLIVSDIENPVITNISRTTLIDALNMAKDLLGLNFPYINYYHFKYPEATKMLLFVKTVKNNVTEIVQFKIPQNYVLFEASFYHYGVGIYSSSDDSKVKIDGYLINDLPETANSSGINYGLKSYCTINHYQNEYVTLDILHTIEINYIRGSSLYVGSGGIATLLIFNEGQ